MGIKEGEQETIPDLGFDSRFKYDNVMINDKLTGKLKQSHQWLWQNILFVPVSMLLLSG